MRFVHLVDTDENEHYVNLDAIVNVRTTMSGGTFIDVNGLEAPIFMRKHAKDVVEMIVTGDMIERAPSTPAPAPQPAAAQGMASDGIREPGADAVREPGNNEIREPGTFIVES